MTRAVKCKKLPDREVCSVVATSSDRLGSGHEDVRRRHADRIGGEQDLEIIGVTNDRDLDGPFQITSRRGVVGHRLLTRARFRSRCAHSL